MRYKKANIILVSVAVEGLLVGIFLLWVYHRAGHGQLGGAVASGGRVFPGICGVGGFQGLGLDSTGFGPTPNEVLLGLGYCIPLFIVNFLLFGPLSQRLSWLHSCYEFKDRVVRPLAAELDYRTGLIVALCAGFGEELFFRGVLANEFGIIISSLLFSLMHFGPAVVKFRLVASIYAVIGLYFGWIYAVHDSIWIPIITHAAYDYAALVYMRYFYCFGELPSAVRAAR